MDGFKEDVKSFVPTGFTGSEEIDKRNDYTNGVCVCVCVCVIVLHDVIYKMVNSWTRSAELLYDCVQVSPEFVL